MGCSEGVTQGEPGPGQVDIEINVLPREPDGREEEVGKPFPTLLAEFAAPAEEGVEDKHEKRIEPQRCNGPGRRNEPDPESGGDVEKQQGQKTIPAGAAKLFSAADLIDAEEGREA